LRERERERERERGIPLFRSNFHCHESSPQLFFSEGCTCKLT